MAGRELVIASAKPAEGLVEFIVTFYGRFASERSDLLGSLSVSRCVRDVSCFEAARDERGHREEEWIYFVALVNVDAFERAIALCKNVRSYERSFIPGDCAKVKTFFGRRNAGVDE